MRLGEWLALLQDVGLLLPPNEHPPPGRLANQDPPPGTNGEPPPVGRMPRTLRVTARQVRDPQESHRGGGGGELKTFNEPFKKSFNPKNPKKIL